MTRPARLALWYVGLAVAALAALRPLVPPSPKDPGSHPLVHDEIGAMLDLTASRRRQQIDVYRDHALNVVVLGDSTALNLPRVLQKELRRALPTVALDIDGLTFAGFSALQEVLLNERLLDGTVHATVLILNTRFLGPPSVVFYRSVESAALVPIDRLATLDDLPWQAMGIDWRSLWLAQLLRVPAFDFVASYYTDLKALGRTLTVAASEQLNVARGTPRFVTFRYVKSNNLALAHAFDPSTWDLERLPRFLEHIVATQAAAGIVPLVVVNPVPTGMGPLRDPAAMAAARARLDEIAARVRARGGRVLDLHALLAPGEFADPDGHYGARGNEKVGTAIAEALAAIVKERPPRLRAAGAPAAGSP